MSIKIPLDQAAALLPQVEKKLCIKRQVFDPRHPRRSMQDSASIEAFQVTDTHLVVPFYFGIENVPRYRTTRASLTTEAKEVISQAPLRDYQEEVKTEVLQVLREQQGTCLMAMYPGAGKCFGKGTEIRMWDGRSKAVESLRRGDVLHGFHLRPVIIRDVVQGKDDLFRITSAEQYRQDYIVNRGHLLTVFDTLLGEITDERVEEVLKELPRYRGVFDECGFFYTGSDTFLRQLSQSKFPLSQEKYPDWTFAIEIRAHQHGDYFGFRLFPNECSDRFLLAQGSVSHNTMTALDICAQIRLPTLIVTHRLLLMDQWMQSIEKCFGKEYPAHRLGGQSTKKEKTSESFFPFYVMNGSQSSKMDLKSLNIGTLVVDECHAMVTKTFCEALLAVQPRYLLGLSATPYRQDGYHELIRLFFGTKHVERKLYRRHQVMALFTDFVIPVIKNRQDQVDWNDVLTKQSESEDRNRFLVDLITYLCERLGRRVLVLCKRKDHIESLRRLFSSSVRVSTLFGNQKDFDPECHVLMATFQKVGVGFSFDVLDALVLGSDCEDYFLQYLGRVFRRPDVHPLIVDIIDKNRILEKHYSTRKKVYLECGGVISAHRLALGAANLESIFTLG